MSLKLLIVFAVTEFLLSLTPGPAVLLVVSQGMRADFKSSVKGTLGILTGNAIYFALSAVGLGALLMASATLFGLIKWLGACYLIVIDIKMLTSKNEPPAADNNSSSARCSLRLFSQGLITQLSNPKAILFFAALLPQFVSMGHNVMEQFVILGVVSITVEFPVLLAYGWVAERGSKLTRKGRFSSLPDRVAGAFLIGAGVGLASMRRT